LLSQATSLLAHIANSGPVPLSAPFPTKPAPIVTWLLAKERAGYAIYTPEFEANSKLEIRCQFVFSGKNDELTPDFRNNLLVNATTVVPRCNRSGKRDGSAIGNMGKHRSRLT